MRKIIFAGLLVLVLAIATVVVPTSFASGKPIGHGSCCDVTTQTCPPTVPACY